MMSIQAVSHVELTHLDRVSMPRVWSLQATADGADFEETAAADTQRKSLQRQERRQRRHEQQMQVGHRTCRCRALIEHVFQGTPLPKGCSGALAPLAGQQTDCQTDVALPQGARRTPDPQKFCM